VDEITAKGVELKLNTRVDDAVGLLGEYQRYLWQPALM